MAKKHLFPGGDTEHHKESNTTEGGKCLVGHSYDFADFKNKTTCNYRYQAYEQAKSNNEIKDYLHSYNDILHLLNDQYDHVETSAYKSAKNNMTPAYYCAKIVVPKKGDWDIGGPKSDIKRRTFAHVSKKKADGNKKKKHKVLIKKKHNFTQDTWPYWNNAHHLISKGTLKNAIISEGSQVGGLMEVGLLKAGYNVNHKRNMLFLPQDKEVGEILDMPRHIQLKHQDGGGVANQCLAHPVYDEMVKEMEGGLKKIIAGYREKIEDAIEKDCETPKFSLDKTKLEQLSDDLLEMILEAEGGRSLDKMAQLNNP